MTRDDIFKAFQGMFPDYAAEVKTYKKIGSKTIWLRMKDGSTRTFLYNNPNNWNFGTKQWRKRPDPLNADPHGIGKKVLDNLTDKNDISIEHKESERNIDSTSQVLYNRPIEIDEEKLVLGMLAVAERAEEMRGILFPTPRGA